jgi:transcriptional regulator with XRE-family HTH domain
LDAVLRWKIWRDYRGLTLEVLVKCTSVSQAMIEAIEAGHKTNDIGTLKRPAAVLGANITIWCEGVAMGDDSVLDQRCGLS